ncbi:hypothetical protein HMPREF3185_00674 [Porphyromonas somerae]|uniref:Uncharacterized protein n=1 Tax=Porphyromonas somerae TaxID=322095 RepID=A0A134BAN8_9PORP|nr:hypothetical protein HMPREF3184_00674 [Porphyromonadaceae bacterium KA00676]KXB77018.1 hypothetical protein HMPREF3185_00674 [Porphyromonas somerae]
MRATSYLSFEDREEAPARINGLHLIMTGAPMTEREVCTIRGVHASVIDNNATA